MSTGPRLVLVGGGHSHVEVLRRFGMMGAPPCNLTLVARDMLAPYSGMLPGFIAGHYRHAECHIDVRPLARAAGARVCHAEVTGIDFERSILHCAGRPEVPFDVLAINAGSRPEFADVPGAREHAWPAKPVDALIARWEALLDDLARAPRAHGIVVVGAGAGGVELSLAMRHRLNDGPTALARSVQFALVEAGTSILPSHAESVRRRMSRALQRHGIVVHSGERVAEVIAGELRCESGRSVPFDTLIWTTHAAPLEWLRGCGLATDEQGFVAVNASLQSISHPNVFASGDAASLQHAPRPKSGVFAVREGPPLAENLRRWLANEPLERYEPQARHLSLISTGNRHAVASWGGFSAEGAWVWRWKDHIDRTWMAKYQRLPMGGRMGGRAYPRADSSTLSSPQRPEPRDPMQCAGCGAKLGHDVLQRALDRLQTVSRPDVIIGLDSPDDAAIVEPPHGMLSVHTIDAFPALVADPYLAGRIAAVHCLSDIYAMGATPHTALAVATLPQAHPGVQEDTLVDLLAGALSVLMPEHAALIGGHTIEGERLEFGLSVNGVIARERLLNATRPQPDDRLILTKPLGIGAIFAADMRGEARSPWIAEAVALATRSNADAARILFGHDATACTDVTGFGLAGHLLNLLRKYKVGAEVVLDSVPVLEGARFATRAGIRSTLYPANAAAATDIDASEPTRDNDAYPLLFDPQTGGGLVASIPADRAASCVEALHAAGYDCASDIGRIQSVSGTPPIRAV